MAAGDDAEARDFASRADNPRFRAGLGRRDGLTAGRIVVNGIVGAAGLRATLVRPRRQSGGLASKESLVAGGRW